MASAATKTSTDASFGYGPLPPDCHGEVIAMSDSPAALPQSPPPSAAAHDGEAHGRLASRSFVGLLLTQFLGAMNDNIFRWLVVPIGKDLAGPQYKAAAVSAGLAVLTLPFILLVSPAGYFADRFSKRTVIVACKVAEILIMILGMAAILYGNIYVMFFVLFLTGSHSAIFSPSKYGSIPEIVRPELIPKANGLIGMTTILAIVVGAILGGYLYYWTTPPGSTWLPGHYHWWISAAVLIGVAATGCLASLLIRLLPVANPKRRFPVNLAGETFRDLSALFAARPLLWAALGSATFWGLGGLFQANIDRLTTVDMQVAQQYVGLLLAILAVGVGLGNLVAGVLSAGRIELGIVPVAAAGISITSILLCGVPGDSGHPLSSGYLVSCVLLFFLGLSGGMYDLPLVSFLQAHSPTESRGSILAAANFLTFTFTFLASGVFWFLASGVARLCGWEDGLCGRTIFLVLGIGLAPLTIVAIWRLPRQTLSFILRTLLRLLYRVRIEGSENVPSSGGILLASNHVSWLDGFLVGLMSPRHVRFLVYADYFSGWWARWFARLAAVIPIQPGRRSIIESLRVARQALLSGDAVGIFPEGGITRSGQMQPFQPGFLKVLKDTEAPVVPVYLDGLWGSIFSFEGGKFFWKRPRRLRMPVLIRFGRPIYGRVSVEDVREAVRRLGES